jgi:alpha-ketoglutarate-dependent taurine dioxygenase
VCRTVQAIALDPELHFRMVLEPGDIQWVHNTSMLHTRDGFTDGEVDCFCAAPR